MENERKVLSPLEVALQLGVNRKTVYKMLQSKQLPSIRCGDKWVVPIGAFNKYLMECNQATPGKNAS